jgi:hypothetical protein
MERDKRPTSDQSAVWGQKRELIQAAGRVEILDLPFAADALDHPRQDRPEIGVDVFFGQGLQRINERIDFESVRKRLSTPTNEHERIDRSRGART